MNNKKIVLTEMQEFTINFLKKERREVNPSYLGSEWFAHKNDGRYCSGGSRGQFGTTSAAYRTLRKLEKMELVAQWNGFFLLTKPRKWYDKNIMQLWVKK